MICGSRHYKKYLYLPIFALTRRKGCINKAICSIFFYFFFSCKHKFCRIFKSSRALQSRTNFNFIRTVMDYKTRKNSQVCKCFYEDELLVFVQFSVFSLLHLEKDLQHLVCPNRGEYFFKLLIHCIYCFL